MMKIFLRTTKTDEIAKTDLCLCHAVFFLMLLRKHSLINYDKRQKDCLWKQRTHYRLENGSLGFIETLHKQ